MLVFEKAVDIFSICSKIFYIFFLTNKNKKSTCLPCYVDVTNDYRYFWGTVAFKMERCVFINAVWLHTFFRGHEQL